MHHFFFSHTCGTRLKYLPKGCPYILTYSALHIMQWFSQILDVLWIKTNVAYTRLEVIARTKYCTTTTASNWFVTSYYKLLPAVSSSSKHGRGNLAFYHTLNLWLSQSPYLVVVTGHGPFDVQTRLQCLVFLLSWMTEIEHLAWKLREYSSNIKTVISLCSMNIFLHWPCKLICCRCFPWQFFSLRGTAEQNKFVSQNSQHFL